MFCSAIFFFYLVAGLLLTEILAIESPECLSSDALKESLLSEQDRVNSLMLSADQGCSEAQYLLGVYYTTGHLVEADKSLALKYFHLAADRNHSKALFSLGVRYAVNGNIYLPQSFVYFKRAADFGHVMAQVVTASSYLIGRGVVQDRSKAFEYRQLAALGGHVESLYLCGLHYKTGYGVHQNATLSTFFHTLAASRNHSGSMFELGRAYATGYGVAKNETISLLFVKNAADRGHIKAMMSTALMYDKGFGVTADAIKSLHYYTLAADRGNADCQLKVGLKYSNRSNTFFNRELSLKYYTMAAEQNNPTAMFVLANHNREYADAPMNPALSLFYLRTSADLGYAASQYQLGILFETGLENVGQNLSAAFKYYTMAGEQNTFMGSDLTQDIKQDCRKHMSEAVLNNSDSQHLVGSCYFSGFGFERNIKKSIWWFKKSGITQSHFYLASIFHDGLGVIPNKRVALKHYRIAADAGHVLSQFMTGRMLYYGEGVTAIKEMGLKYLQMAAENGEESAERELSKLNRLFIPSNVNNNIITPEKYLIVWEHREQPVLAVLPWVALFAFVALFKRNRKAFSLWFEWGVGQRERLPLLVLQEQVNLVPTATAISYAIPVAENVEEISVHDDNREYMTFSVNVEGIHEPPTAMPLRVPTEYPAAINHPEYLTGTGILRSEASRSSFD